MSDYLFNNKSAWSNAFYKFNQMKSSLATCPAVGSGDVETLLRWITLNKEKDELSIQLEINEKNINDLFIYMKRLIDYNFEIILFSQSSKHRYGGPTGNVLNYFHCLEIIAFNKEKYEAFMREARINRAAPVNPEITKIASIQSHQLNEDTRTSVDLEEPWIDYD